MKLPLISALGWSLAAGALAQAPVSVAASPPRQTSPDNPTNEVVVLPGSVPDPIEPFNRVVFRVNEGIMSAVVAPTARLYRTIVAKPIRTGIGHVGRNLTFPGRLINNLLQGKWHGARDETYGFLCNTTVGVAGFFDVATKWGIPQADADFGQTFGQWGWDPACFLMLPIFGPSNERDALGLAADTAANPLTYITPYPFSSENLLTYVSPYTYVSFGILYNNLSDSVDKYVRTVRSQMDAYAELQYAWTFVRKNRVADFRVTGKPDAASLETLEAVFFTPQDPEFPGRGKTRSVLIPATGRELKFTYWLQPGSAPVVYIVPGLGSHRLAEPTLALAELVHQQGFSAVCVSSPFNSEFMEAASTAQLPGYMPVDVPDLRAALAVIDHRLHRLHPGRMGAKVLMGFSMGAFESLLMAATEGTNMAPGIRFDRYVAINSPVRLLYAMSTLDEYYRSPLAWPAGERLANIENTFLKVASLSKSSLTPQTSLPFNGIESKFLIGLSFRLSLRDAIFSSQRRNDQGVLEHRIHDLRRTSTYQEILQYSYQDYVRKFVIPYYRRRGVDLSAAETLERCSSLRAYTTALQTNQNLRVIENRDDFLLAPDDMAWLEATMGEDRLKSFDKGAHLGNLSHPAVRKAIARALEGLPPAGSAAGTRSR